MWKTGLSTCGAKPMTDEMFNEYAENKIECIELSFRRYEDFDFPAAQRLAQRHGINLWSLHLPFLPFAEIDPSALEKEKRDSTIALFNAIMERSAAVGLNKFIVHPSMEIHDYDHVTPGIRKERLKASADTLSRLADKAEKLGAVICVEDLPRRCLGNCWEEMSYLTQDERLRICFDTNHILKQDPTLLVEYLGQKIVTLHVSDYDFLNERHWLPGEGKLDFTRLVQALKDADYQGAWLYEVSFGGSDSILRDRDLTCADFARNAYEVQNGKPITVLGKPNPKLYEE